MEISTKSQAENGNNNSSIMTPLRVKQAIKSQTKVEPTPIPENKVLWEGAYYMAGSHEITLSEQISKQNTGIVLVWQRYVSSTVEDYDINYVFIPKYHISAFAGKGVSMFLTSGNASIVANKYLYILDSSIIGDNNNSTGATTRDSGIKTTNSGWVLTKVLGV